MLAQEISIQQVVSYERLPWDNHDFHLSEGFVPNVYPRVALSNFHALVLCRAGELLLRVDGQALVLQVGSLLLLLPRQACQVLAAPGFKSVNVLFTSDFLQQKSGQFAPFNTLRFLTGAAGPALPLTEVEAAGLLAQLRAMQAAHQRQGHPYTPQICCNLLVALLYNIQALCEARAPGLLARPSREEQLCQAFYQLLVQHVQAERAVGFYADKLYVTPKHLSFSLKRVSGKTAHEWLEEALLRWAKALLENLALPITEIAETLHYSDHAAFYKFFKKHTGYSPNEFRGALGRLSGGE